MNHTHTPNTHTHTHTHTCTHIMVFELPGVPPTLAKTRPKTLSEIASPLSFGGGVNFSILRNQTHTHTKHAHTHTHQASTVAIYTEFNRSGLHESHNPRMSYLASCVLCSVLCIRFRVCVVLACVVFCCASCVTCCSVVVCCVVLCLLRCLSSLVRVLHRVTCFVVRFVVLLQFIELCLIVVPAPAVRCMLYSVSSG